MPRGRSPQLFLGLAEKKEKTCNWLEAIVHYEKALNRALEKEDFLEAGRIQERVGYCFYRASFQAETGKRFRSRMRQAFEAYKKAAGQFKKVDRQVRSDRCKASAKWVNQWIAPSYAEKKTLLDRCTRLWKEVASDCRNAEDLLGYGKACNELLECLLDRFEIEQEWSRRKAILIEGLDFGEEAMTALSELADDRERARAFCLTSLHCFWAVHYGELEWRQRKELKQKCLDLVNRAMALSRKVGDTHLVGLSYLAAANMEFWLVGNLRLSMEHAEEVLNSGKLVRDNYLIGQALSWLAAITYWMMMQEEDPDRKRDGLKRAADYSNQAVSHLDFLAPFSPETIWVNIESCTLLAREVETRPEEKRVMLARAIEIGRKAVKRIMESESLRQPEGVAWVHHSLSKAFFYLSQMETESETRRELLLQASELRGRDVEIADLSFPNWYWYHGVGHNYQALILADLSTVEDDDERRRDLLEKAIANMDECLRLCREWTRVYPQTRLLIPLGMYYDWSGTILRKLHSLTGETENLYKTIDMYKEAIETFAKTGMHSWLAEIHWKTAQVYDQLGKHAESAQSFESASENYKLFGEKIPQLRGFYSDYVAYLQAWSEIEEAKNHHSEKQYGKAKEHYEKAAVLHKSTDRWSYLGSNYMAWARLEEAEDLSRREQAEEAKDLFRQASKLFEEARKSIKVEVERIEDKDEKEMSAELVKASETREQYCAGRILLEEGKILDRQGDHLASSRKYGSAAEIFQEMSESKPERELKSMTCLCQAWEEMMTAEAKASPNMYGKAAELFEKAKEYALDEPTSTLALANSSFCKALEAGTNFEFSKDATMYSEAKKYMATAANSYLKAGFDKASAWVNAAQNLFDSYIYIGNAEAALEPEEKTKFYNLAERCLQRSADLYETAQYVGKRDEVLRTLEMVQQKREFMMSLLEVLETPSIASSTTLISAPGQTHESAVGLGSFDHANIQARLTASQETIVGDVFEVRLDLVNVAKTFGLLARVDNLVPSGFKVAELPAHCILEDGSINLKGKKLDSAKVESVKILMEAKEAGVFRFCPEVVYIDEVGKFHACRSQPVEVTVHPPLAFKFKTEAAGKVFDYLVRAFVKDYMRRKLFLQEAGWRSLGQIAKNARVSLRSVYGNRGRSGAAVSELERRGMIETRIFLGGRGRGGRVTKARISYEKETLKRYVDHKVVKSR